MRALEQHRAEAVQPMGKSGDTTPSLTDTFARTTTIDRILVDTQSNGSIASSVRNYTLSADEPGPGGSPWPPRPDQYRDHILQFAFSPVAATAIRINVSEVDFGGYYGGGIPPGGPRRRSPRPSSTPSRPTPGRRARRSWTAPPCRRCSAAARAAGAAPRPPRTRRRRPRRPRPRPRRRCRRPRPPRRCRRRTTDDGAADHDDRPRSPPTTTTAPTHGAATTTTTMPPTTDDHDHGAADHDDHGTPDHHHDDDGAADHDYAPRTEPLDQRPGQRTDRRHGVSHRTG